METSYKYVDNFELLTSYDLFGCKDAMLRVHHNNPKSQLISTY